jgi:hypothetical protein
MAKSSMLRLSVCKYISVVISLAEISGQSCRNSAAEEKINKIDTDIF